MRARFERVYRGSGALAQGIGRGTAGWFKEGRSPSDFVARLVFMVISGALLWGFVETAPFLMWAVVAWWVVKAYQRGKPTDGAAVTPPPESSEPASTEETAEADPEALVAILREVAAPNAHLAVVAEKLGTDTARVREALSRAGIPVSDVRMKGRGVSTGVKASDIPSPRPSPETPGPVVGPGHGDNNNTGTNLRAFPDGTRALFVDDPQNPARTNIQWLKPGDAPASN
ncbi:hypothetical protein ACFWB2_14620 [Streptomyces virginiae]|uniref:hypothetical protein n=1 Tax=Streptomyces TaxID=1883 RepID=UPI00093D9BD8|nr:hypothetical protein [Streptomyces sp. MJM1172]OKI67558.1 hypothetical protein AMK15_06180 [Streptomyces sp. MJM1172]